MCSSCVGIFMFHHVQKVLMTFWTFRSISVTTGSVSALKRTPPNNKLAQEYVTDLQYTNASTCLSCFHQSGGSRTGQISTRWIQKWLLILKFSAKDKSQMWVNVGEIVSGVDEVLSTVCVPGDLFEAVGKARRSLCSSWWTELTCWYLSSRSE